jgi:hypothetical protein
MIKVMNLHTRKGSSNNDFYIGRTPQFGGPSPLANPFTVEDHGRSGCIRMYMKWLNAKIDEHDTEVIDELKSILDASDTDTAYLMCHCKPKACHGDVIMIIAEERRDDILGGEDE